MNRMFNVMIGNYTLAVVGKDEEDVKRILKKVVDSIEIEEVERHKGHEINVLTFGNGKVVTRCVECSHYFFQPDGRKQKKDGFVRPINMAWDDGK